MGGGHILSLKRWLGLDLGSSFIKAALIAEDSLEKYTILPVGGSYHKQTGRVLKHIEHETGISFRDMAGMGITGVGAEGVDLAVSRFSDVAAHAKGVHLIFPEVKTIIDIGGQFTRVIRTDSQGKVRDFLLSEKCATGSGRFLQIIARILRVGLEELGSLSLKATHPVEFSTACAVFAESEAISRIAEGANPADIVAGVHQAMAAKVEMLMRRIGWEPPVALVGGGGEDEGLIKAIEGKLAINVLVPPIPRITAAIGAANLVRLN